MASRIGIAIESESVSGAICKGRDVTWHAIVPREGRTLPEALDDLLARVPRRRFRRRAALVALGPAFAQFKSIEGLPAGVTAGAASLGIRENVARFFLNPWGAVVAGLAIRRGDEWWAAAMSASAVDAVAAACNRAGIDLLGCVPSRALGGGDVIADDAAHSAAFAAATSPIPGVSVDPLRPARMARLGRIRRAILASAAGIALIAAAVGPGIRLRLDTARDRVTADSLRQRLVPDLALIARDRRSSESLDRIRQFGAGADRVTLLLGALASALPDSAATVSFRADSVSGTLVLLSPPGVPVLSRLASSPAFASPRLVGALTREAVAGVPMQRIAIAFRRQAIEAPQPRRVAVAAP